MPRTLLRGLLAAVALAVLVGFGLSPAAQLDPLPDPSSRVADPADKQPVVTVEAVIHAAAGNQPAQLLVTAKMRESWHIYSITQAPGGPIRSEIKLDPSPQYKLTGQFQAAPPAKTKIEPIFNNLPVETHEGTVTWTAPLEIADGVKPTELAVAGKIFHQACTDTHCLNPEDLPFTAKLQGNTVYTNPVTATTLQGHLQPQVAQPGGKARLTITASPGKGWHIYAYAARDPDKVSRPTLIVLTETSGIGVGATSPARPPLEKPSELDPDEVDLYYDEPISWTVDLQIPADVQPGNYEIAGLLGYQTCNEKGCDRPRSLSFEAILPVAATPQAGTIPLTFSEESNYREVAQLAEEQQSASGVAKEKRSLLLMIGSGLLGGLILNLMPCVLPVIGLKILSFVQQSSDDRGRTLLLNVWYAAGLISVFLVLATLAVWLKLGWGEQFTSTAFNIAMAGLVWVMALSFLGVWEIPIPGFIGAGKTAELAQRGGLSGAFAKGVLTTILATPCSGPFLGTVFGYTLTQPPWAIYTIFFSVGLGMSSPYLLIGAFPTLVRFLPKPGAWMDTFKQMMGFVLLGTVAFLFTFIDQDYLVRTFALLIALWAGCWWIGRTPLTASLGPKLRAWTAGAAFPALVALLLFGGLFGAHQLSWQPFSRASLEKLTAEGNTVLVDFTADW